MLTYQTRWKKISLDRYNHITKGLSEMEIIFLRPEVRKELKQSFYDTIPKGIGVLEYTRQLDKLNKVEYSPEDYDYYIEDGNDLIFMGGEKSIKHYKKIFGLK